VCTCFSLHTVRKFLRGIAQLDTGMLHRFNDNQYLIRDNSS
jgi:hypothetical protein